MTHLRIPNIGGGAWSELKYDDSKFPTVAALQEAALWKLKDLYAQSVWSWLCDEEKIWPAIAASTLETQLGPVTAIPVALDDREENLLMGPLAAILKNRMDAQILWAEIGVQENYWSAELDMAIAHLSQQQGGFRLALWGTDESVQKAYKEQVVKLTAVGGILQGYRTRVITVFMPRDDPLPYRVSWSTNVIRQLLLVSPTMFKQYPDYIVSHIEWVPGIVSHTVAILDVCRFPLAG